MNRRRFLQTLGIVSVGLYVRLAPSLVKAVPQVPETQRIVIPVNENWEFPVHDTGRRFIGRIQWNTKEGYPLYVEIEAPFSS